MGIETMEFGHAEKRSEAGPSGGFPWLLALILLGVVALVAALVLFVFLVRQEQNLQGERALLVGRCFSNGIGATGRLIEVWNGDRGLLAFSDGHTTPYPFKIIKETPCP
jgi:hypothetical protein